MKKLILFLVILTMGVTMTHAQSSLSDKENIGKRHELYFGVGLFNLYVIDKHDKLTENKKIPYNTDDECFAIPVHIGIDYKYRLTRRISVGVSVGITDNESSTYFNDATEFDNSCGSSSVSCMYALPTVTYTWFTSGYGIFRAYSGAGLGLALLKEKVTVPGFECNRTKADFGYNVTLVGMSLGGESFRYFCELNVGCKSVLTAGLLVRF